MIYTEKGKNLPTLKIRSKTLSGHFSTIKLEPKTPLKPEVQKKNYIKQKLTNAKRKFFNSPELTLIT